MVHGDHLHHPVDQYAASLTNPDTIEPKLVPPRWRASSASPAARSSSARGATFYAVAVSVCHIVKCIFSGADTTMTVSTMMHGEYGIDDVCLSTLAIVGPDGVAGKVLAPLTDEEKALLKHSSSACAASSTRSSCNRASA